jgi:SNF2 family DNA or RNA helicase
MSDLVFEPLDVVDTYYDTTDWQAEAIESMLNHTAHAEYSADWSEMGCYKTTTALWLLQKRAERYKSATGKTPVTLIITSKAGKGTYFDAIPKAKINATVYNIGVETCKRRIGDLEISQRITDIKREGEHIIFLAHYEVFSPRVERVPDEYDEETGEKKHVEKKARLSINAKYCKQIEWTNIVCDEAHKLKNPDTKWTRQIKRIRGDNKHIMTGTGFVNRPDEMWSLLHFLNEKEWPSYWSFREEYCEEYFDDSAGTRIVVGIKPEKLDDLIALQQSLGPRFFMSKVHPDIGEPIFNTHTVDLGPVQRKMFDDIKNELYTLDQQGFPITSPNVLSALNRMRQISVATPRVVGTHFDEKLQRMRLEIELEEPSSKLDKVMELIDEIRWDEEIKRQIVVFSSFKDPLKLLETRLQNADVPYLHLKTEHNEEERYRMWHDTFPSKEHKVFMSTLQLGGESINLACASYLIFLDRDWSPKNMLQAVGRVYRPGQTEVPEVIYIDARSSIDGRMKGLLDIKGKWFTMVFGDKDKNGDSNGD